MMARKDLGDWPSCFTRNSSIIYKLIFGTPVGIKASRAKKSLDEDGLNQGDQKRVLATPGWFSGV